MIGWVSPTGVLNITRCCGANEFVLQIIINAVVCTVALPGIASPAVFRSQSVIVVPDLSLELWWFIGGTSQGKLVIIHSIDAGSTIIWRREKPCYLL